MLRPRTAGPLAVLAFALLGLSVLAAGAQEPPKKSSSRGKAQEPASTAPQTYEESTRFLKSIPPKPATELPYPSIATPPIEDQAPIPLLTESQLKQAEEELTKLNERHQKGMPKVVPDKQAEKKRKKRDEAAKPTPLVN